MISENILSKIKGRPADAAVWLEGSQEYPNLEGRVLFYDLGGETLVEASFHGLEQEQKNCGGGFLGFHIHDGESCTGNAQDPFANAGMHYNPKNCPHPLHAGDLPPILISNGRAYGITLTSGFTVDEIRGKTMILHAQPDDFTTQPSGNSGKKIACGKIISTGEQE